MDLKWAGDLFDDLPEGAVITDAIAVVSYMVPQDDDDDNGMRWGVTFSSEAPVSTNIGLLALAQHRLLTHADEDSE